MLPESCIRLIKLALASRSRVHKRSGDLVAHFSFVCLSLASQLGGCPTSLKKK